MKGKVKFFNEEKRYGFISGDDGADYFVHASDLSKEITTLTEDEQVSFDVEETDKGKKAKNVTLED